MDEIEVDEIEVDEIALGDAAAEIVRIKAEVEALEKQRKALQAEMTTTLLGSGRDEIDVDHDGGTIHIKVVTPERTVTDEGRLRKKLGAAKWKKVTSLVLDKAKLEAAVQLGEVDIKTVAECSHLEPTTPYVKITNRGGK